MGAFFDDFDVIQHDDPVHLRDCAEAVGDGDDGFPLHHTIKRVLDRGRDPNDRPCAAERPDAKRAKGFGRRAICRPERVYEI